MNTVKDTGKIAIMCDVQVPNTLRRVVRIVLMCLASTIFVAATATASVSTDLPIKELHGGTSFDAPAAIGDSTRADTTRQRTRSEMQRYLLRTRGEISDQALTADTSKGADTSRVRLTRLDSLYMFPPDSSVRLRQFTYQRRDIPQVSLAYPRVHPFYLDLPLDVVHEARIDSSGTRVTIRETVGNKDVKVPLTMSLDEYLQARMDYEWRKGFEDLAHKYELKQKQDELTNLLGNITNIEIPIPANPILSIFGDRRSIRLNINGGVDIRGSFRNEKTDETVISQLGNVRNEPDFKQDVQIGVNGTVGDKLNIMADWNTQRTFEYENQLKIKYTGYEDEIVQSIEGGNVSLQTPSSFVGSSQALFGIKAQFQVGPLKLTTLASQKKGQVQEQTYSGGQHQSPFELHAYAYAQNHFFLDTVYRKQYESYYGNPQQPQYDFNLKVTDIEVWITNIGPDDPNQQYVVAKADLPDLTGGGRYPDSLHNLPAVSGQVEVGKFIKLKKDEQYFLHEATGFITLAQQVRDEQAVAVAYRTQDGRTYGDFLSTRIAGDTILILKLVKPRYLIPSMQYAWRLQLRSIYPVGGRGLKKEGFVMNIYYQLPGQEPQDNIQGGNNLLQVFGLDRTDESGTGPPDNKFDYIQGITIDEYRGELIFPSLEPFREGIRGYFQQKNIANPDSFIFADIYDTTLTAARNNGQRDRFLIKGKYIGSVTSTHNIGFNLVEGSVHVTLNGAELTPNVDYAVDYILGQVSIKNEAALVPGANLQIKYEQNDLFQFASKTLLGARGEFNFSKQTQFGFSILNLNQQTLSEKVRIGEEPISNTIMGIDGATTIKTPFITDALNLLPLIQQSREESNITLRGEAAYMLPDPNTKKSPIPVDNNEGIAYVDDFEGAKLYTPLGIGYAMWHSASPPAFHPTLGNIPDSTLINNEAKLIRYNIIPGDVLQRDIWPNKTPAYGEEYVTVLSLAYDPAARGEFNYKPDLSVPTNNWAGIMRLIPSNATNLVDNNYEFLEIWLQIEGGNPGNGKMIVDLGRISEDVVVNDKLDTEDGYDGGPRMQVLRAGEDVGLDALSNDQEKAKYADLIKKYSAQYPDYANDPSGDDYYYAGAGSDDFSHVNGTEGNGTSETGRFPDTEDLNNNGVLDRVNNYFEYEINLDTSAARNPQIVGGGSKGWYQYKIPLSQYMRKVGDPDFSIVEFVRVWLTGFPGKVWIRIADVSLSGNQWLAVKPKGALSDSSFVVSVVNIEDNPSYSSPPDLPRARDLTRPDQTILVNEQSLALLISNLADGESRYAYRTYSARPLDVFNYKILRMFVHCDEHFNYVDTSNYDCEFFFRFGVDTLNFYEYREPLRYDASDPPGWRGNEIAIDFGQITAVKEAKDSVNAKASRRVPVPNGAPGATYQVVGNPTLTGIRFLCVGVTNPSNKGTRWLTGQVWVDEMRLSKVNDAKGWAYRFDASIKLADFGSVQVNMSKIDPNFHGLEQRFGSRNTSVSWGFGGNFSLQRFLPREWSGTALSFTYSHTEGFDVPQYVPGTDVLVDEAATRANEVAAGTGDSIRTASQTLRVSDTWTIPSVKVNIPSNAWYVRDIINRLSLSFNYNSSKERNPTTVYRTSWTWNSSLNYSLSLSPDYYIVPFKDLFNGIFLLDAYKDVKIYFTPSSVNFGVNGTRSRTEEQPRTQTGIRPPVRNFTANRQFSLNYRMSEGGLLNLATDYSMSVASSLVHLEVDTSLGSEFPRQRSSSEIFGDIFFKEGIINFGFPSSYNQTITISSRPKLPPLLDIDRYLEITPNYSASYSWQNNFQQRDFGRSASVNSTLQLSVGFRLKQLTDPWFKTSSRQLPTAPSPRQRGEAIDTSGQRPQEGTPKDTTKSSALGNLAEILKIAIKIPFLDYDNITINFTQNNSSQNNGILGDGTGFMNLWGRVPFFQSSLDANGPSRLYQLGLIGYPNGRVTGFGLRPYFPFFGFNVEPGLRAPTPANMQVQMTDVFSQRNQFDIRTSRPLWEGARLDLNWKVGWSFSRNQTIQTDTLGVPTVVSIAEQGDVDRSFLSLPDIFPFNIVATSGIAQVGKLYDKYKSDQSDTRSDPEKLAQAFQEGMESLPFLTKIIGNVLPRANWVLRWDGLEKLSFLERVASRVSLEHSYTSQYTGRYRITTDGTQVTESQRVSYGFNPLLGVNITFKELWGGSFGGSFRFSMQTAYDLANGSQNINETSSTEASLMASYGRRGFEIPLFGLSLRNDVDISFSFTYSKQSRRTYDVNNLSAEGTPLEGQSRTQIEPRFKYVLSTRVTASLFYRYVKTAPDATAARIPGTTTNELGLEVHISISGQ